MLPDDPRLEFSTIEAARLRLRPFQAADITTQYVSWLNDPAVTRYSNQRFVTHTEGGCAAYLSSFSGTANKFILIEDLESGDAVGTMTIYFSLPHGTADVGIMLGNRDYWGRGYGQEAWNSVLDWLQNGARMRKITAGTMRCNLPMMRVMERSGMVPDGVKIGHELLDGVAQDLCYFAKFGSH